MEQNYSIEKKWIYYISRISYICKLVILWNYYGIVLNYHLTWYICSTTLINLWLWKLDVPDTLFCVKLGHKVLKVMKRKYFNDGAPTFLYLWVEVKHLFWITNCLFHIWTFISVLLGFAFFTNLLQQVLTEMTYHIILCCFPLIFFDWLHLSVKYLKNTHQLSCKFLFAYLLTVIGSYGSFGDHETPYLSLALFFL